MLALTGKAIEGEVLTAVEVIPKCDHQQFVWNKYIKEVKYQWYGIIHSFFSFVLQFLLNGFFGCQHTGSKKYCAFVFWFIKMNDVHCHSVHQIMGIISDCLDYVSILI